MLILPQFFISKWNSRHKKYYQSKGYIFTQMGDEFEVNVLDLPDSSVKKVKAECDYCTKIINVCYHRASNNQKVSCASCRSKRTKEMYGYSSSWEFEKTKQSIKITFLEKYGVDHNFKSPEVQEKRKQTFMEKFGTEHPAQSDLVKEKTRKTSLEKYGVEHFLQHKEVIAKREETNLKRYGVKGQFQTKELIKQNQIKRIKTLHKNGSGPSSRQQRHINELVCGELNYPIDRLMLDIAFPDEKIYIEYNGGGHDLPVKLGQMTQDEFNNKEIRREKILKYRGWKLIRIVCLKDKLPEDEIIINLIKQAKKYLTNTSQTWLEIDFDK